MNRILPVAAFVVLAWTWPRPTPVEPPTPVSPERELAALFPERCRVYVEGAGVLPLLEQGLEHPFVSALRESPLGVALTSALPRSPEEALAAADAWLGKPVLASLADLGRRGVALGFDPETKKSVVVAIGADPERVASALAALFAALGRQFGWPGNLDRPEERRAGAGLWSLGKDAFIAHRADLVVMGNERELVDDVVDRADDPGLRGLLARPGFAAHHGSRPRNTTLWAWLELAEIEPHADEGFRKLRAANRSPAVQGLLGADVGALLSARALSVALALDAERGLELTLRAFEAPCSTALAPRARAGEVPAEVGAAGVATALVYRDYARFFGLRADLFPPETLPGFAEAVTNGALFFEGKDLGEEVLPHLSPWIRLVSRELEFDPARRPEIPLPGLAAVAVLDDEREGEAWAAAFQTIVAIASVDKAQKGGMGLRLQLAREGEVEITSAHYASPGPGDGVDVRYNLEPALAVVGRHLVLGTHVSLVRELARELAQATPSSAADGHETLELGARGLRNLLDDNFEFLVAQKMLEDGLERAGAEHEIDGLRRALASFESARLEVVGDDPTAPEIRLELHLARAEGGR